MYTITQQMCECIVREGDKYILIVPISNVFGGATLKYNFLPSDKLKVIGKKDIVEFRYDIANFNGNEIRTHFISDKYQNVKVIITQDII